MRESFLRQERLRRAVENDEWLQHLEVQPRSGTMSLRGGSAPAPGQAQSPPPALLPLLSRLDVRVPHCRAKRAMPRSCARTRQGRRRHRRQRERERAVERCAMCGVRKRRGRGRMRRRGSSGARVVAACGGGRGGRSSERKGDAPTCSVTTRASDLASIRPAMLPRFNFTRTTTSGRVQSARKRGGTHAFLRMMALRRRGGLWVDALTPRGIVLLSESNLT